MKKERDRKGKKYMYIKCFFFLDVLMNLTKKRVFFYNEKPFS